MIFHYFSEKNNKAMLKKVGIGCLSVIGLLVIGSIIAYFVLSESKPEGQSGAAADQLANEMLGALNKPAWDTLRYISWDFTGRNQYAWDKQKEIAVIKFGDNEVVMDLKAMDGIAKAAGVELTGEAKDAALGKAWGHWCNDSFWLYAHYKLFDPGVTRSIVEVEDGKKGLMASYSSGGATPGDSYLWILDQNNKPEGWKMWVGIIPIGGVYNTWENWKTLPGGAMIAQNHKMKLMDVTINDLKAGQNLSDIGYQTDPFSL